MKSKKSQKKNFNIEHNKYVMYILLVVAIINLLMYLQKNYLGSILLFLVIGLLTTLYTKNMNIILFSTIVITNIILFVGKMFGYVEEFELEGKKVKNIKCKDSDGKKTELKMITQPIFAISDGDEGFVGSRGGKILQEGYTEKIKEGNTGATGATGATGTRSRSGGGTSANNNIQQLMDKAMENYQDADDDDDDGEGFKSLKEDIEESNALSKNLKKNNIPKGTEKEIKRLLGGADIKSLNTNELLEQQKGLMDAMKNMDPLIKNVNEMINNLKNSPISGFMGLGK